ncbi:hypothetical protein EMIT0P265_100099 [Pseudomonas zeae]
MTVGALSEVYLTNQVQQQSKKASDLYPVHHLIS